MEAEFAMFETTPLKGDETEGWKASSSENRLGSVTPEYDLQRNMISEGIVSDDSDMNHSSGT